MKQVLTINNARVGLRVQFGERGSLGTVVYRDTSKDINQPLVGVSWDSGNNGLFSLLENGTGSRYTQYRTDPQIFVIPDPVYVQEKHLQYGTRVQLNGNEGKIACVGSWFIVVKFDNGDDSLLVRKNGKLYFRRSKTTTETGKVCPLELVTTW